MNSQPMPELVDTHCHIQSAGVPVGERTTLELWAKEPELTGDAIIADAVAAGVTRMLCVGCDLADSKLAIDFVQARPQTWATIGIHPHEAQHYVNDQAKQQEFAALATLSKVVAIGECGLDYFYEHSSKDDQIAILKFQIELAQQYDLPIIFHVREAFDDFWPIFEAYHTKKPIFGVLHSYTDSSLNLQKALHYNLFIGVNGIVTFVKQPAQLTVYQAIPLQKLLLETDAPFLTPTPYRGTINQSKRVGTIAEYLATLRGESREELAIATTNNAISLFQLT
jgi:TatD DNase family protein